MFVFQMSDYQSSRFEHLPNELFLDLFSTYFDGRQLYNSFLGLNSRFTSLLHSLSHIHLPLDCSNDDKALSFFNSQIVSVFIGAQHMSVIFIPLLRNVRSITLVDPSIVQIMNLLQIASNLKHVRVYWSNPLLSNVVVVRSFYELIFCAGASRTLRSCRLLLATSGYSSYLEPRLCSLPMLRSLHVQVQRSVADFQRILRLCPHLVRLEVSIVESADNIEDIQLLNEEHHHNIRRFYAINLPSLHTLDAYIKHLPRVERLFVQMTIESSPLDVFDQISNLLNRLDYIRRFDCYFSIANDYLGQYQIELLQKIHPLFGDMHTNKQTNSTIFTTI